MVLDGILKKGIEIYGINKLTFNHNFMVRFIIDCCPYNGIRISARA